MIIKHLMKWKSVLLVLSSLHQLKLNLLIQCLHFINNVINKTKANLPQAYATIANFRLFCVGLLILTPKEFP